MPKRTKKSEGVQLTGLKLKFDTVDFKLFDSNGEIVVRFCYEHGKPTFICIFWGDKDDPQHVQENCDGRWKPCVTHVRDLIQGLAQKPPRSEHARQRAQAVNPRSLGGKHELKILKFGGNE